MYEIGEYIRILRRKMGLTQSRLAEKLGVQFQTVSKWETAASVPDTMILPAIADALCVSIDELFGRARNGCAESASEEERVFLLKTYAQMYAPEAGRGISRSKIAIWNTNLRPFLKRIFRFLKERICVILESEQGSGIIIFPIG